MSTLIGYGSPNLADTHDVHGAALGAKETEATRKNLKWEYGEFEVPAPVYDLFGAAKKRGQAAQAAWNEAMASYAKQYPEARPPCAAFQGTQEVPEWVSGVFGCRGPR